MRIEPNAKYQGLPCSFVGVGCAYEDIKHMCFCTAMPEGIKEDGYLTLDSANRFIRQFLSVKKKVYYKRDIRIPLKEFLNQNTEKCCICVLGHFIYVSGSDYWSFFDNEDDPVVCVWYLKEETL